MKFHIIWVDIGGHGTHDNNAVLSTKYDLRFVLEKQGKNVETDKKYTTFIIRSTGW